MARFNAEKLELQNRPEPFEYEFTDGTVVVFKDPKGLHYKKLMTLGSGTIDDTMQGILGDDYDKAVDQPEFDGYLMEALFKAYQEHFGLPSPGESPASSTS